MGVKIEKLYEFAGQNGGLATKMRLAMACGVPSTKAAETPDSPELIAKMRAAIKEITGVDAPTM